MRKPLLLVALLLWGPAAWANTFDTFGFDPRAIAMGGAQTADARDFTATFYNPSQLVLLTQINTGLGFTYEKPSLAATQVDPTQTLSQSVPNDFANYSLGFVYPFGGKVQDHFAVGLGIALPVRNLLEVKSIDPNTANWYLYDSSPDRIQIFLGAGLKIFDWLTLGGGIQALSDFGGTVNFNVDLFNKAFLQRNLTNDLTTKVAPVLGITFLPLSILSVAFSWRAPMDLNYDLPNNINLGDLGNLFLDVHGTVFYTPNEFTLGVKVKPLDALTLTADLEYALWSKAPNPGAVVTVKITGVLEQGLGLENALDIDSQNAQVGFQDIWIPRFGAEYMIGKRFAARAGYYFRPTMIPEQNGLTNLLDADTHGLSVGLGAWFDDPLEILHSPIELDLAFQHQIIVTRTAEKPPDGPVPTYTYGGSTDLLSIDVRYNF